MLNRLNPGFDLSTTCDKPERDSRIQSSDSPRPSLSLQSASFVAWPILGSLLIIGLMAPPANAAEWPGGDRNARSKAEVIFDTGAVLTCKDISDEAFLTSFPGDRLLEAEIEISSLHRDANRNDIEYLVQVYSAGRVLNVVDYEPKTTVAPKFDGSINVETTREGSASVGIDASGAFEHIARVTGHATAGGKTIETERYQRLPPHELLLAAGLMNRGAGVYFKVRSSPATSMEGGRRFTVRFRVSEEWRAGFLRVACVARADGQSLLNPLDIESSLGRGHFVVATYLEGDRGAKQAAENYARSEYDLRRIAAARHESIKDHSYANSLDRFGASIGVRKPRIPRHWLSSLMAGDTRLYSQYESYLPEDVRDVANQWLDARSHLADLNGSPSSLTSVER